MKRQDTHEQFRRSIFRSLDLLRLEPDGLSVDEYTFAFVGFRRSPFSNVGGELCHNLLVDTFQEQSRGLRSPSLHALRNTELNRMCESNLQGDKLLSRVLRSEGDRRRFDGGTETNSN